MFPNSFSFGCCPEDAELFDEGVDRARNINTVQCKPAHRHYDTTKVVMKAAQTQSSLPKEVAGSTPHSGKSSLTHLRE
eukprot:5229812-Amphidinium_carterae.1